MEHASCKCSETVESVHLPFQRCSKLVSNWLCLWPTNKRIQELDACNRNVQQRLISLMDQYSWLPCEVKEHHDLYMCDGLCTITQAMYFMLTTIDSYSRSVWFIHF